MSQVTEEETKWAVILNQTGYGDALCPLFILLDHEYLTRTPPFNTKSFLIISSCNNLAFLIQVNTGILSA